MFLNQENLLPLVRLALQLILVVQVNVLWSGKWLNEAVRRIDYGHNKALNTFAVRLKNSCYLQNKSGNQMKDYLSHAPNWMNTTQQHIKNYARWSFLKLTSPIHSLFSWRKSPSNTRSIFLTTFQNTVHHVMVNSYLGISLYQFAAF